MRYSVQPGDKIFVKSYRLLSFAKTMGNNIGKNISKNLSWEYSQKLLDHAKQSATDALKTSSKRVIQKTAETTGDLIGNKIANAVAKPYDGRITKIGKSLQLNNSETITNEHDKKIPKERLYLQKKDRKLLMI